MENTDALFFFADVEVWGQEVGTIRANGEKETLCNAVAKERPDPRAGGGEPFNKGEAGLGQGDPVGEVVLGVQCWGEPVAKPSNHPGGADDEAVQCDGCLGGRGPLAGGPPVDKFCFGGRKLDF